MKKLFILTLCFCCIFLVACKSGKPKVDEETKAIGDKLMSYDIVPDIASILKSDSIQTMNLKNLNLESLDLNNIPKDYDDIVPQLEEIQLISEAAALDGMNMLHRELPEIPEANTWVEFDHFFYAINTRYSKLSYTDNSVTYANYLDMDYEEGANLGSYRFFYISVVDDGNDKIIFYHSIIHDSRGNEVLHSETHYKYIKGKIFVYQQKFNNSFTDLVISNDNIDGEDIVYGYCNSGLSNDEYTSALDFTIYGNEETGYFVFGSDNDIYLYKDGYRLLTKKNEAIGAHVNLLKIQITDYDPKYFDLKYDDGIYSNITVNRIKINNFILNGETYEGASGSFDDYNYTMLHNEESDGHELDTLLTNFHEDAHDLLRNFLVKSEDYRFKAIKTFWPEFDPYQTTRNDYREWFSQQYLAENFMSLEEIKEIPSIEEKIQASDYDFSDIVLMDEALYEVHTEIENNNVSISMLHSRHNADDPKFNHFQNGNFRKVVALMDISNDKIYPLIQSDYTEFFNSRYIMTMTLDEFHDKFNLIPDGKYLSVVYYEIETPEGWERYGEIYSHDWTQIIKNEVLIFRNDGEITKVIRQDIASCVPNIYYKHITINSIYE